MPKTEAASPDPVSQFEDAMKALETLVQQLEQGDLPLEKALEVFERGMALSQQCKHALETATQRVETVMARQNDGE
jgi:exodeoxyribonuclease VII small subunit